MLSYIFLLLLCLFLTKETNDNSYCEILMHYNIESAFIETISEFKDFDIYQKALEFLSSLSLKELFIIIII